MVLGGVVYLHDISHDRFSGTARRNLEIFRHLCGDAALNKVVLGTTKWKRVPPNDGTRREEDLKAIYWKDMIDKGTAVCQFRGSNKSAWELIDNVIRRMEEHTVLEIQKELSEPLKLGVIREDLEKIGYCQPSSTPLPPPPPKGFFSSLFSLVRFRRVGFLSSC